MDREERFKKICEELETWSDDERHFALWLLLRDYAGKLDIPREVKTIEECYKYKINHDLYVDCNELIDMLNFELWR